MQLDPALMSYAGLTCWALSTHRLRRDLAWPSLPAAATMRMLGILALALAAFFAIRLFGPYQGPVAWFGFVSVSGLLLLLLLSRWPRLAVAGAIVSALLVAAFSLT